MSVHLRWRLVGCQWKIVRFCHVILPFQIFLLDCGVPVALIFCFFLKIVLHCINCDAVYVGEAREWFRSILFLSLGFFAAVLLLISKIRGRTERVWMPATVWSLISVRCSRLSRCYCLSSCPYPRVFFFSFATAAIFCAAF